MAKYKLLTLLVLLALNAGILITAIEVPSLDTRFNYYDGPDPLFNFAVLRQGSYVYLEPYPHWCVSDISLCSNGFSLTFRFLSLPAPATASRHIIITNGGHASSGEGFFMQQEYGYQYSFTVKYGTGFWQTKFDLAPDTWYQMGMSWYVADGLKLYVDGLEKAVSLTPSLREFSKSEQTNEVEIGLDEYGVPILNTELFYVEDVNFYNTSTELEEWSNNLDETIRFGCTSTYTPGDVPIDVSSSPFPIVACRIHCQRDSMKKALLKDLKDCSCSNEDSIPAADPCTAGNYIGYIVTQPEPVNTVQLNIWYEKLSTRAYIMPNEDVKIFANLSLNLDVSYEFIFENVSTFTSQPPLFYHWESTGTHTVIVKAMIGTIEVVNSIDIVVEIVDEGVVPKFIDCQIGHMTQSRYAYYNIYSADDYDRSCSLSYGDTNSKDLDLMVTPFKELPDVRIYYTPGQYNVTLVCNNTYGFTDSSKWFLAREFKTKSLYLNAAKNYSTSVFGSDSFKNSLNVEVNSTRANYELNNKGIIVFGPEMIQGSDNLLTVATNDVILSKTIIRAEKYLTYPEIICNTTKGSWSMNIEFNFVIPAGDHVMVNIDYGLGPLEIEYHYIIDGNSTQYINTTKAFTGLGQYRVILTVSNDVSSLSTYKDLTSEIPITSIDIVAQNETSLTSPVVLHVDLNSGSRGPVDVHFDITFDDGNTAQETYHNLDEVGFAEFLHEYTYSSWGIYNIFVRAYNNISSVSGSIIVQVGQNITFLDVTTEVERIPTGNDVTFSITCPTGSDITYSMHFGDGTTFSLQESSTEPTSNEHTATTVDSDRTVTMVHTYSTSGYFNANVTADNVFGSATSTLCPTVVVDDFDTSEPPVCAITMVTFKNMNSSLASPYPVKRSEDTVITVDEEMSCKINSTSNYSWKATKLSLVQGTQTEETVHEICLFQERNNTLTIPALALPYGLYKITVTVAPDGFDLNSFTKVLYLRVIMSNPIAFIDGGDVQSFLVYATAIFDISQSRDPDLRYDWRTGVFYDMFCMPEYKLAEYEDKTFDELTAASDFVGNKTMFRTATKNNINFHQIGGCFNDTISLMDDLAVYNGKITFAANYFTDYFSFGFILYVSRANLVDSYKQIVEVRKSNASLDDLSSLLDIALTADPDTAIRLLDGAASSILNADPSSVDDQEKLASNTEAVVGTLGSVAKRVDNSNQATKCAKTFSTMTSNKDLVTEESRSKAADGLGDLANGTANMEDATVEDAAHFAGACLGGFDNIFPTKVEEKKKDRRQQAADAESVVTTSPPDLMDLTTMATTMSTESFLQFTTSSFLDEDQPPPPQVYDASMAPCDVAARLLQKLPELNTYDELLYFICDDCALFRKVMKRITVTSDCPCVTEDEINQMQCSGDFTYQDKIFAVMTFLEHPGDLYMFYVKPLLDAKRQRDESRRLTDSKVSKSGSDALMTVAGTINNKSPKEDKQVRSFESSRLGLKVQKVENSKNGTKGEKEKQSMAMPTGSFNLPLSVLAGADCDNVNTMFLGDKDNPFTFSKEKANVGKGVLSLGYSCNGEKVQVSNTNEPIELWMNRESEAYVSGTFVLLTRWGEDLVAFNYHPTNITDKNTSLQIVLKPFAFNEAFDVYVSFGIRPNETHFDHMETVPKESVDDLGEIKDDLEKEELLHTVTVPLDKTTENGTYWVGVKLKRGTVSLTGELTNHTYSLLNLVSGCRYWDEEDERWSSRGCSVGKQTTKYRTQCFCDHLTSFGSDFVVPVNTIDFTNVWAKFKNLSENAAVFSTIISILGIYMLSLIWARWMDKKDLLKWGALPLTDNLPTDNYHYQLTVQTGMRKNAGTDSKISFILSGDDADTGVRRIWDDKRTHIPRGSILNYVLSVDGPLGPPSFLRIWHDNSGLGKSKSWYLDQVQITDLQTGEKFFFLCDRWLAVEEDDGMVDRIVPVAGINDLIAFKQLFSSSARKKLANEHLWVSVFSRPTRSNFTRVQRISCCMALLFLTMITNCMFFKAEDNVEHITALTLGPFQFTLQQVYISVVSTLIVFPVSFLLVTFFRRCRPKKNAIMQNHQQVKRNKFKWKNVANQAAMWGPQAKKTRMGKLKDSLSSILAAHQKSKYEEDQSSNMHQKLEKKKRKKEPWSLPHWCLYIGWVLCFLSIVGSAFFTILYSMEWGKTKSNDWLITFLMSFFQSVIIIQPIKVLLIVAFLSCILKKPDLDEEDLGEDFDTVLHPEDDGIKKDVDVTALMMQRKLANSDYRPPDLSEIEETRQLRLNEIKMEAVIKDILTYFFFVIVIFFLSYQQRDSESYQYTENLRNRFASDFDGIQTVQNYWTWLERQFLPNFYATHFFNNTQIKNWQDRNFISDMDSTRVGVARIRQMRIKEDSCELRGVMKTFINHCRSEYGWIADDTKDYFTKWVTPVGINESLLEDAETPWVYQNSVQLKNAPYVATLETYKGGGYVALTKRQLCRTNKVIEHLKSNDWIDLKTRAIFLEFTVYNPNSNLFGSVVLVAEFMALGGVVSRAEFKVFRLLSYIGAWGIVVALFEVIYACFTLFFFVQCIKKLKKEKMKYFKGFWSLLEFVLLTFAVTVIAMYAFKHILTNLAISALHDRESDGFVNFQSVALYDETYGYIMSFVVFLATIQFLKLLQFNQKMNMLGDTIRIATKDLKIFSISFLLYFFSFTASAYLLFGQSMVTYNSVIGAAESMFAFALGSFDFDSMADSQRILGPIFFFLFIGVVYIGLMSIFLTIIGEAFTRVKADVTLRTNEYEIVDFMWKRFKALLGLT